MSANSHSGGTNYKGNMLFTGEGMGANIAPALFAVNPVPPYNSTGECCLQSRKPSLPKVTDSVSSACKQLLRSPIQLPQ
jgi:hypothetical protein